MACAAAHAADYRLDPVHTQIEACASHTGFSHPCARLRVQDGHFRFDADDWSTASVDATIDVATLDMGDAAWSDKMRSAYLDTHTYPTAHYVGTRVEKTGANSGMVHGKLTLLGRTQPLDLQIVFNRAGLEGYRFHYLAGFSADAKFKRSAFGMTRGLPDVGDEVSVHIEAEGLRGADAKGQAAPTESDGS